MTETDVIEEIEQVLGFGIAGTIQLDEIKMIIAQFRA